MKNGFTCRGRAFEKVGELVSEKAAFILNFVKDNVAFEIAMERQGDSATYETETKC